MQTGNITDWLLWAGLFEIYDRLHLMRKKFNIF